MQPITKLMFLARQEKQRELCGEPASAYNKIDQSVLSVDAQAHSASVKSMESKGGVAEERTTPC